MSACPPVLRVDVASGAAALAATDVRVRGPLPFQAARVYRSRQGPGGPTPFGVGWTSGLGSWLELGEAWTLRGGPFDGAAFAPVAEGREAVQAATGLVVQSRPDTVVVFASTRRLFVYGRAARRGTRLPLVAVRDRAGAALALRWAGDTVETVEGAGAALHVDLSAGQALALVLADGRARETVARFEYTLGGQLVAATDAAGRTTRYGWDGDYLVELTDAEGARQHAQYDADGRCLAVWHDRAPVAFALGYDPLRQTTRVVDAAGGQTLYAHVEGQVLERIAPAGHSDTYLYDEASRLIGLVRDGAALAFQRLDPESRRLAHIAAELRVAFVQYDAEGLAAEVEDAFENTWRLTSREGALAALRTPRGAVWEISRDRLGRATAVGSPGGRRWTLAHGRTASVDDAAGRVWTETRDAQGRPLHRTDRLGRATAWTWKGASLDALRVEASGHAFHIEAVRDGLGRIVRLTEAPARASVRYTYDATGLVVACDVDGTRVQVRSDALGRPIEAAVSGRSVRVGYDVQGRIHRVEAGGVVRRYHTDDGVRVLDAHGVRRYSPLGELLAVESGEATEAFTYGPCGELLVWERSHGDGQDSLLMAHDADGRLEAVSGRVGATEVELRLGWDPDGILTAVQGPEPEPSDREDDESADEEAADRVPADPPLRVAVDRDASGRLTGVRWGAERVAVELDAGGRLTAADGSGGRIAIAYDVLDRPAEIDGVPVSDPRRIRLTREPGVVLVATRGGVLLGVELGSAVLAVWAHAECRAAPMSPTVRACVSLTQGPGAALPPVGRLRLDAFEPWLPDPERELAAGAVPRGADLGLPPGPLDLFALDRSHLCVSSSDVGALDGHVPDATRDDHDATTGPHRSGALRPAPWASRAVGPHLQCPDLLLREGRVSPDDLVDLALLS